MPKFICHRVNRDSDAIRVFSSFGTHPCWILAKIELKTYLGMLPISTGKIRDSDTTRVCFEFRDSSFMDSCRIKNGALIGDASYAYRGNLGF